MPVNVTLFGSRVFVDVINGLGMSSPRIEVTGVLLREKKGRFDTKKKAM